MFLPPPHTHSSAYIYSLVTLIATAGTHPKHDPKLFFETGAMLFTFVSLGRFLEHMAKGKTSNALSQLMSLQATNATLVKKLDDGTTETETIAIELVQRGDLILVRPAESVLWPPSKFQSPSHSSAFSVSYSKFSFFSKMSFLLAPLKQVRAGEKFPVDGIIVSGACHVDEAMITGESMLISKKEDSAVIGGTILQSGMAQVRATHVGKDASLARIVQLMEQAQMSKAPVQRIAGRWCREERGQGRPDPLSQPRFPKFSIFHSPLDLRPYCRRLCPGHCRRLDSRTWCLADGRLQQHS